MTKELTPLEALHKLYWDKAVNNEYGYNGRTREDNEKFHQECKELNDIIEKALKALEIIKDKAKDQLHYLVTSRNYDEYLRYCDDNNIPLNVRYSLEEYYLLKEVLL